MHMVKYSSLPAEAFDFSQDALEFRERLWKKLKACAPEKDQPLEDDDLEWVNAAGVLYKEPENDRPS